jgi:PilZ domain
MNKERRTDPRVPLNLPARYDGLSGAHEARIEDISLGGCFVNARGQVDLREIITLEIKLATGEWLSLRGEVTAIQPGIGFGLVFSFLTEDEQEVLTDVIISAGRA